MDVYLWKFSKNPPNSASVVGSITFLIILNSTCTSPSSCTISIPYVLFLYIGPWGKYPPALVRASGSEI